jgi:hypothetical protein
VTCYSHCICILYCFFHSFFMHTTHLLLAHASLFMSKGWHQRMLPWEFSSRIWRLWPLLSY